MQTQQNNSFVNLNSAVAQAQQMYTYVYVTQHATLATKVRFSNVLRTITLIQQGHNFLTNFISNNNAMLTKLQLAQYALQNATNLQLQEAAITALQLYVNKHSLTNNIMQAQSIKAQQTQAQSIKTQIASKSKLNNANVLALIKAQKQKA